MTMRAVRRAARNPWLLWLASVGFAARAAVYAIVAVLAVQLAFGTDRHPAGKKGALAALAEAPFGRVLLVALAVGFGAYALWRLGRAAFPTQDDRRHPARRLAHLGTGLLYAGVCATVIRFLTGLGGGGD